VARRAGTAKIAVVTASTFIRGEDVIDVLRWGGVADHAHRITFQDPVSLNAPDDPEPSVQGGVTPTVTGFVVVLLAGRTETSAGQGETAAVTGMARPCGH
jgi:hypothetical protein